MNEGIFAQHRLYLHKIKERSDVFVLKRTKRARVRLLSGTMHNLVVCSPDHFPEPWLRRMRGEEITCSVSISSINRGIDHIQLEVITLLRYPG